MKKSLIALCPIVGTVLLALASFSVYAESPMLDEERELRREAERGVAEAQYLLASKYFTGDGVARDLGQAGHWYQQAATRGHAEAQFIMGVMSEYGHGVQADKQAAAQWYYRAGTHYVQTGQAQLVGLCRQALKRIDPEHTLAARLSDEWAAQSAANREVAVVDVN